MIRGLKLEQQGVFIVNDKNEEWIKATTEQIKPIENLLRTIENLPFSNKDIKENVVFEKEFNIGLGSVKSFKDEDGDLVYTFHKDISKRAINIDEDLEFESGSKNEKNILNCWTNESNMTFSGESLANIETDFNRKHTLSTKNQMDFNEERDDINRRKRSNTTISNNDEPEIFNAKFVNTKIIEAKMTSPEYTFVKRRSFKKNNVYKRALSSMLQDVKSEMKISQSRNMGNLNINYMKKKSNLIIRRDGGLVNSIIRYNKMRGLEDTIDSLFYLNTIKSSRLSDDDFDKLIDSLIEN